MKDVSSLSSSSLSLSMMVSVRVYSWPRVRPLISLLLTSPHPVPFLPSPGSLNKTHGFETFYSVSFVFTQGDLILFASEVFGQMLGLKTCDSPIAGFGLPVLWIRIRIQIDPIQELCESRTGSVFRVLILIWIYTGENRINKRCKDKEKNSPSRDPND